VGQILGPVKFDANWWIVKCLDKSPVSVVPYSSVRLECFDAARESKGLAVNGARVEQQFTDFEKHSNLQAFVSFYAPSLALP
jgi:hypothetical protein